MMRGMHAISPPSEDSKVRVLYDAGQIQQRIADLGREIAADYAGGSLCAIGILKGSFVFMADLVRAIDLPVRCEFMSISSYGDALESSGVVQITADLQHNIQGEDVLVVEDIIDTGLTMEYLLDNLRTRRPRSIRICSLLEKPENAECKIQIDYLGFRIPNAFVVGYGLDVAGFYRNLPYIGIYDEKG